MTLFVPALALAAQVSLGEREYQARCAMCHGAAGKGDGWLAGYLMHRTPALTQLKKNNGGVFPVASVTQVIDGRTLIALHGPREMPVWGYVYRAEMENTNERRYGVPFADEGIVRVRLLALIDYLARLQE